MSKREVLRKRAIYIRCKECGFEYLEDKEWFIQNEETECPNCKSILEMK